MWEGNITASGKSTCETLYSTPCVLPSLPYDSPKISLLLCRIFYKSHKVRRNLGARCAAFRIEQISADSCHQTCAHRPAHSFLCVRRNVVAVAESGKIFRNAYIIAFILCISVEDRRHLLSGDRIVRRKQRLAVSEDDTFRRSPGHRVGNNKISGS